MKTLTALLVAAAVIVAAGLGCASQQSQSAAGKQSPANLKTTVTRQITERYLLYLPTDYSADPQKRWPLVIFLHGKGERGENLDDVKAHGPPMLVAEGRQFPFVLVSPQCPDKQRWNSDNLDALLDDLLARYRIDADRVYLTGLSMGGWGTWQWISRRPERFAAAVPICGSGDRALIDRGKLFPPVWAFHGDEDEIVPLEESKRMVEKWRSDGGEVKLTVYPGVKHDSWTQTYQNQEMWDWLLSKKRGEQ